jgi:hypothetical protein
VTTIGLELKTACGRCGENVPVNGVVDRLVCPRCHDEITFDAAAWRSILETPALEGPLGEPNRQRVDAVKGGPRAVMRFFSKRDATCARCKAVLPMPQSLQHAARGWCACVQCGEQVSVRVAPPAIAGLGGVTHLIGEDPSQIGGAAGGSATTGATSVRCDHCGAALPVDVTSSRTIGCTYCKTSVILPDDVWARLHPLPQQRAWFLYHDAAHAPANAGSSFAWKKVEDVAFGRDGHLYFVGENDGIRSGGVSVWSTDARFSPRWVRADVPLGTFSEDARIAVTPDGHVLVWRGRCHWVLKLACADGATVAKLGGKEAPDAKAHGLDLEFADDLAVDPDGSILAIVHRRILRWAPDGEPVETWPTKRGLFGEKHQKLSPLFRTRPDGERDWIRPSETPRVREAKSRPLEIDDDSQLAIGPDGATYLQRDEDLLKLARDGTKVWAVNVGVTGNGMDRPRIDAHGNVYVLRRLRSGTHGILRVSADGSDVRVLVDGDAPGTPMAEEWHFAVSPDGTIFVVDYSGVARVFGPNGAALFASPKAREADAYRAKRRTEEAS